MGLTAAPGPLQIAAPRAASSASGTVGKHPLAGRETMLDTIVQDGHGLGKKSARSWHRRSNIASLFNTAVVLPLANVRHEPFFGGWYVPFLFDHALFVGLPISLVLAMGKWERRVSADGCHTLRLVAAP